MLESVAGSVGSFVKSWEYIVDGKSLTQETADEFIRIGHAEEIKDEAKDEKKVTAKKLKSQNLEQQGE